MSKTRLKERQAARQQNRQRRKLITQIATVLGAAIIVGGIAYLIWAGSQPAPGRDEWEEIPTQEAIHIDEGNVEYEPWNSDPPTSGYHLGNPMQPTRAGFFEESIPDENLVHSLEHGYVILWYDCSQVSVTECTTIKDGLRSVVEATETYKVVAMPREVMETPIIAVSWGMMYKQSALNEEALISFVNANRERSPEPNAP
jgi:hypothetical protein